jgi:hypothetical protein
MTKERGETLMDCMQTIKILTTTFCKQITFRALIIVKLLYSYPVITRRREGTGTLPQSMQTIETLNIAYCKKRTCSELIACIPLCPRAINRRREREGAETLLYSMQMNNGLNIT